MEKTNRYNILVRIVEKFYPYINPSIRMGYPKWFTRINSLSILPIYVWPGFFYFTIFLFDNPETTVWEFILLNSYPVWLLLLSRLSYLLFKKSVLIATLIPVLITLGWMTCLVYMFQGSLKRLWDSLIH